MKSIKIILGIVLFSIITLLTPSCIPTGGGTPTPVVSDSLAFMILSEPIPKQETLLILQ
jgi:hypothetical protein